MTALWTYFVSLVIVHVAWAYFYLCGSLVRAWFAGPLAADEALASDAVKPGAALLDVVVASTCGMAITGLATFALGLVHLLYAPVIAVWLVALAVAFAYCGDPPWQAEFWRARARIWRTAASPGAVLVYAAALVYGFAAVRPDLGSDATFYYLVYALDWADAHALVTDFALRPTYYTNNWVLVDVWPMMFRLYDQPQSLVWLTSMLSLFGIYGYVIATVETAGRAVTRVHELLALLATAAVGTSALFLGTSAVALIDSPIGLFYLVCGLTLAEAVRTRRPAALAAFLLCGGFFIGMKMSFAVFWPFLAAAAWVAASLAGGSRKRIAIAVCALTLIAAPWYVKNFIEAGDPIPPVLNLALHGVDSRSSKADAADFVQDLHSGQGGASARIHAPLDIFADPTTLAFRAGGATLIMVLVWLPIAIAAYAAIRRRQTVPRPGLLEVYALSAVIAFAVAYWFESSYFGRYAQLFLPALGALFGGLAVRLSLLAPSLRWASVVAIALCALPDRANLEYLRLQVAANQEFASQYQDREAWMIARAPTYREVIYISDALRRAGRTDLRVYRAYTEEDALYFRERGIATAGDLFGPERYFDFLDAVYTDRIAEYVDRFHLGAFLVPSHGNVSPAVIKQLGVELAELGFTNVSVTPDFTMFLAPGLR